MLNYLRDFWEQFDGLALLDWAARIVGVLLCLTVHETCHGLAALALGDPTAKRMHRLSLNPLRHIDWLGLAAMVLCGFGWARPVPVDMSRFKDPKSGMALTALAGPASNLILAFLLIFAASLMRSMPVTGAAVAVFDFLMTTATLSIGLGLFNLIPIPPLDGSRVVLALLPERAYYAVMRYERYGMLLLLALVWLNVGGSFLTRAISAVFYWMTGIFF